MTNREWLNNGNCKGKQCRDGFVVWLKKEHEDGEAERRGIE